MLIPTLLAFFTPYTLARVPQDATSNQKLQINCNNAVLRLVNVGKPALVALTIFAVFTLF